MTTSVASSRQRSTPASSDRNRDDYRFGSQPHRQELESRPVDAYAAIQKTPNPPNTMADQIRSADASIVAARKAKMAAATRLSTPRTRNAIGGKDDRRDMDAPLRVQRTASRRLTPIARVERHGYGVRSLWSARMGRDSASSWLCSPLEQSTTAPGAAIYGGGREGTTWTR
jgi:hypothetical protein